MNENQKSHEEGCAIGLMFTLLVLVIFLVLYLLQRPPI